MASRATLYVGTAHTASNLGSWTEPVATASKNMRTSRTPKRTAKKRMVRKARFGRFPTNARPIASTGATTKSRRRLAVPRVHGNRPSTKFR